MSRLRPYLTVPVAAPGHCPNCHQPLADPHSPFCNHCGQDVRIKAPTVGEFVQQFGGAYFSTEGAFWRTLWRLILLPGQLSIEYFAGRRRHFVLPLRIYLSMSVIMLLALRIGSALSGPEVQAIRIDEKDLPTARPSAPTFEGRTLALGPYKVGVKDGHYVCEHLPASTCAHLEPKIMADRQTFKREVEDLPARALSHVGQVMFVLVPAFALLLKLFYVDKRRRYTEHLVVALHEHAFWFAMMSLMALNWEPLSVTCSLAVMAHPVMALHRIYRTRWWSTLLRATALAFSYGTLLTLAMVLVLIWTFLF